jgi:hypothetical protein
MDIQNKRERWCGRPAHVYILNSVIAKTVNLDAVSQQISFVKSAILADLAATPTFDPLNEYLAPEFRVIDLVVCR